MKNTLVKDKYADMFIITFSKEADFKIEFFQVEHPNFFLTIRFSEAGLKKLREKLKPYKATKEYTQWFFLKQVDCYKLSTSFSTKNNLFYFNQIEDTTTLIFSKNLARSLKKIISEKPFRKEELEI